MLLQTCIYHWILFVVHGQPPELKNCSSSWCHWRLNPAPIRFSIIIPHFTALKSMFTAWCKKPYWPLWIVCPIMKTVVAVIFFFKRLFIVLQNSSIWILELETDIDSWNNSMPARFNKSFPKLPSLPPSYFAVLTSSLTDFHLSSSNSHFLHSPAPQSASSQCAIFTH